MTTNLGLYIRQSRNIATGSKKKTYTEHKNSKRLNTNLATFIANVQGHCDGETACLNTRQLGPVYWGHEMWVKSNDKTTLKAQIAKMFRPVVNQAAGLADTFMTVPEEGKAWLKSYTRDEVLATFKVGIPRPYLMYVPAGDPLGDILREGHIRLLTPQVIGTVTKHWERVTRFTKNRPDLVKRLQDDPASVTSLFLGEAQIANQKELSTGGQ